MGVLVLGLALLMAGGAGGAAGSAEDKEEAAAYFAEAEAYRQALEARLGALCAAVSGVSEVEVLLTLESGGVNVYAADGDMDYVVHGGEGMLLSRRMPPVGGVAVICRAREEARIRNELTALVAAALDIGTHRVHVSFR